MTTSGQDGGGEEWGPWIRHNGKGCPVPPKTIVEVVCEDRFGFTMRQVSQVVGDSYSSWNWEYFPELKRIIRYREKKPKGLSMLESQIKNLKVPSRGDFIDAD